jgi:DHA1 family multidrug resistance protein-like MFS transporter
MLLPYLPIFVEELGIKQQGSIVQWSGLAFGATFLGTRLTAPLWGHLGDKYSRKPMLVRAAVGMAVIMSLVGLAHNVYRRSQLVLRAVSLRRRCRGIGFDLPAPVHLTGVMNE